jgi:hypothetical protein
MERSPKLVRVTKPFVTLWVSAVCWLVGLVAMVGERGAVPLELMISVTAILSTVTVSAAAYWGIDRLVRAEMASRFDRLDLRVKFLDEQQAALALRVLQVQENTQTADATRRHVLQLVHAVSSLGARLDTVELMREPKIVDIVHGVALRASRLSES